MSCHNCSVEEKLEFKRDKNALEEVEKFYYLHDMISFYGGACEAVRSRIGSVWKYFKEWCDSWGKGVVGATGEDLSVLC